MMTREEAIKALRLERGIEINGNAVRVAEFLQGLDVAISALRYQDGGGADKFCANCGTPMTDEAVEIVMEKLEVLKDADD